MLRDNDTSALRISERQDRFWLALLLIFFLALWPRLSTPVSRYLVWYERSVHFWEALTSGDLAGTYQRHHPGVTTMWIAGLGMRVFMEVNDWTYDDLLHPPQEYRGPQGAPARAGGLGLSLVIAASVALSALLLARLTDRQTAIAGGVLLALDPFHITHSNMIHVDGLLAILMLVSALSWLSFLILRGKRYLILSGVFAGLAFLTKSPSWFLIPYVGLTAALQLLTRIDDGDSSRPGEMRRLVIGLAVWMLVAAIVYFLLWPATWVSPLEIFPQIVRRAEYHLETAHPNPQFFAGKVFQGDPGFLYYLASLAWKTTVIMLPSALFAAIVLLVARPKKFQTDRVWYYILIYLVCFTLMMSLGAKKWARYILPAFLALDLLAGWGLILIGNAIGRSGRLRWAGAFRIAFLIGALVIQAITVLRHQPYFGTHHNLLLGGSRIAQRVLHLGDQGEGMDLAARFLNQQPGAERLTAAVEETGNLMFSQNFVGLVHDLNQGAPDYVVFFVNSRQRTDALDRWSDLWDRCRWEGPTWSVSFDGVPYVWICPAYPRMPDAFSIDQPLAVKFGEHVDLLGYGSNPRHPTAGSDFSVTLFWQSDGELPLDLHIFVHLCDLEGRIVGQHDGVPAQGERPTWTWLEREIIEDRHVLSFPADASGDLTLSVGMYDFGTGVRLPAIDSSGERLPGDRVVLPFD